MRTKAPVNKSKDNPAEDALKLHKKLKKRSLASLSKELSGIADNLNISALDWAESDDASMEKLFSAMLEIPMAHYDIWLLGEKLRSVQAETVRKTAFPKITKLTSAEDATLSLMMTGCVSLPNRSIMFPFIQGKIAAVLSILSELTGVPIDLLAEFLGKDIDKLLKALQNLAQARKTRKTNPAKYKKAMQALMRILKRIWKRLTSKAFKKWLIKKVGKEVAEKILAKMAALIVPILGWLYFGILFIGLLAIWWEIILDP